jgi:hypothetical protein
MIQHTSKPVPPPVSIAVLRNHFKVTYNLGEEQVELMIQSSRKSMEKILSDAEMALQTEDPRAQLGNIGHSLKGLLLNMGEQQWAEVARDLELSARTGEVRDYTAFIALFSTGMTAVMTYETKE